MGLLYVSGLVVLWLGVGVDRRGKRRARGGQRGRNGSYVWDDGEKDSDDDES